MAVDTKEQSEILDVVKVEGGVETNEVADGSSLYNSMPTWAMNVNEEGRHGDEDCGNGGTTTHSKDSITFLLLWSRQIRMLVAQEPSAQLAVLRLIP